MAKNATNQFAARYHFPVTERLDAFDGTSTSNNWSGWAVEGTAFTSATGSWMVPSVVCTGLTATTMSSYWVGIDGYNSSTVEQAGTESDCIYNAATKTATASYYAWYEFYPAAETTITAMPVSPGDVMEATISYASSTFTVVLKDVTKGTSFTTTYKPTTAPSRSSAEWIAEAPSVGATIQPMSNFGTIKMGEDLVETGTTTKGVTTYPFTSNTATATAYSGAISKFPTASQFQISKSSTTSSPHTSSCSALSTDGTSFSCTWKQ